MTLPLLRRFGDTRKIEGGGAFIDERMNKGQNKNGYTGSRDNYSGGHNKHGKYQSKNPKGIRKGTGAKFLHTPVPFLITLGLLLSLTMHKICI